MKFSQKILRIGGDGKWAFFSRPFWIFFSKKKKKFGVLQLKTTLVFMPGIIFFENFDDHPGFQPKITHTKHFSRQCTYVQKVI